MSELDVQILDRAAVARCVASFDPLKAIEDILTGHASGTAVLPAEAYMEWRNQSQAYCRSVGMPGGVLIRGEPVYGMKVINAAVSNPDIGLDRAGGVTMLFDPETARPRVMADAAYLSALRTAAYTLLSLEYLGPRAAESASILGCGALARGHLRLLERYQPGISTVYVYDIDASRAGALADWAERHLAGRTVVPCATAREVVAASTVLITLTTSQHPYIEPGWFRPGSFVAHVSLDDLKEEVFCEAEAIFVDDRTLVRENPRRILGRLLAEGKIDEPPYSEMSTARGPIITGTLGDVMSGRCQAVRPRDGVVVSNPFGMSILDVGLLARVAEKAEAEGLGQYVSIFAGAPDR
jgi:ornithine cyclodeaminase